VGETDNIGNPRTPEEIAYGRSLPNKYADYPIRGFEYYDFTHALVNVTFRNYVDNATRKTGAISYLLYSNFPISTNNSVEGLKFENAKPVYFPEIDRRWAFETGNNNHDQSVLSCPENWPTSSERLVSTGISARWRFIRRQVTQRSDHNDRPIR
jgi:hypothetical protein